MKDVFLSYSSKDRVMAARIERALEAAGFSVFWDQEVPVGRDWDSWIREHLTSAKVAVVLWSKTSVASANVKHEAMIAKDSGKLVPAMIEPLAPADFPMGMYLTQAAQLSDYRGGDHPGMAKLLAEVGHRIGKAATVSPKSTPPTPPQEPRKPPSPRTIAAWIGVPTAVLALSLVALQNVKAVCDATGLMCPKPVVSAEPPVVATPPPAAPAAFDPIAAIQGDWAWTGITCGTGPRAALETVDGERTLVFTYKDTRVRHAIGSIDGATINTVVVEPDSLRGTPYRLELTADGKGVAIYERDQTAPDTWEKCP